MNRTIHCESGSPFMGLAVNARLLPPNNFDNAKIGLKCTIVHNETITFNIKIPLEIHNFQFDIANLARWKFCMWHFWEFFTSPPPPPIRKMDRRRWLIPAFTVPKPHKVDPDSQWIGSIHRIHSFAFIAISMAIFSNIPADLDQKLIINYEKPRTSCTSKPHPSKFYIIQLFTV